MSGLTHLYGLDSLRERPTAPVLIVFGETPISSAKSLLGANYCVIACSGKISIHERAEWQPVYGRSVLIWPSMNCQEIETATEIAELLADHCQVKIFDPQGLPEGWSLVNALDEGREPKQLKEWARPKVYVYSKQDKKIISKVTLGPEPMPVIAEAAYIQNAQVVANQVLIAHDDENPGEVSETHFALWEELRLALTRGIPVCNMDNVKRVFERRPEFKGFVFFDEFHQRIFTSWNSKAPRELTDQDIINIMGFLQRALGLRRISKEHVLDAIVDYAYEHKRNEPKDWFESLVWDGTSRIEHFFVDCFGCEDDEYTRAVGNNLWIAMVARIFDPGCKFDNLVFLQGAQGLFKSTAWEEIGKKWYVSAGYNLTDKDFLPALRGKLIVELSELTSVKKADINSIKEIISRRVDNYRTPYDRLSKDHPRQCVFVGTTNDELQIPDNTGARRFWPIKCHSKARIDLIQQNRERLFAEAVFRYKAGEKWHEMPEELTKSVQEELRNDDPWEAKIREFLIGKNQVTSCEILTECLVIPVGNQTQADKNRVATVMKWFKWKNKPESVHGESIRVWRPIDCNTVRAVMP